MKWIFFILPLFFLLIFAYHAHQKFPYTAITIVPVADLVETSTSSIFPDHSPESIYNFLPLSGGYKPSPSFACPRIHQLLFNEHVQVIKEAGDEIMVSVPNAFHIHRNENSLKTIPNVNNRAYRKNKPLNTFWTLKKNIAPLTRLQEKNVDMSKIPQSASFASQTIIAQNIITLAMPFTDPISHITYSAGTHFVAAQDQLTNSNTIGVYVFNPHNFEFELKNIPLHLCIQSVIGKSEKIKQFVWLIKKWANLDHGFIPYVWGGTSFTHPSYQTSEEKSLCINKTETSFFYTDSFNYTPKTGLDCSGIINRAAQICGIPFYLRLSTTIATLLDELKSDQELEEGDIIWKPFHVFIVSDLEQNLIIEARGHGNGEGRVHEIALHKVFKEMYTYDDLIKAYRNKNIIYRLDKDGKILYEIPDFKILKLVSVWKEV